MKIFCVFNNYPSGNSIPENPLFFLKPDTSIILNNRPFFIPHFSSTMNCEAEIVIKINKVGKNIEERFAHRYYEEVGMGIDFGDRAILEECRRNGHPWEIAKSFDGSAPLSNFIAKENFADISDINFSFLLNENMIHSGNTRDMIFNVNRIISHISQFFTIKIGDLIFTGTPVPACDVKINDRIQTFLNDELMMDFLVK